MESIKNFPDSEIGADAKATGPPGAKRNKLIRYLIAMIAGLVLVVGIIMGYNFLTLSSAKVYKSAYTAFVLPDTLRQKETERPIEKAFRVKKYSTVKTIHKKGEDNSVKGEFLNGMANLETNELVKAINSFNEVLELNKQSSVPVLNDETEYYLALAYVKNRDYDLALALLQKIRADKRHTYYRKISRRTIRRVKLLKWR